MPLRHTLLGLLSQESMHGYRLRQRARAYSWIYPMTNASIYPALHALEESGFVAHKSEIHDGRARKIYRVTEQGKKKLHDWLTEPAPQTPCLHDQTLLKIVMQENEHAQHSRNWIALALESLRQEIAEFETNMASQETKTLGTELAHEYGFEMLRLRVRLFEKMLALTRDSQESRAPRAADGKNRYASL